MPSGLMVLSCGSIPEAQVWIYGLVGNGLGGGSLVSPDPKSLGGPKEAKDG